MDITIQCTNPQCQAHTSFEASLCTKCQTPLSKRYLGVLGEPLPDSLQGSLLVDRYWVHSPLIVLDTQPAQPPTAPENIPDEITPYLQLFTQRLHIPQVYGLLSDPKSSKNQRWLLDYGTLPDYNFPEGLILPRLLDEWPSADPIRQLHWLWQIAQLWTPFRNRKVTNTLLDFNCLAVNGTFITVYHLKPDIGNAPKIEQLAHQWSLLIDTAKPEIKTFLATLCQFLSNSKQIKQIEHLVGILDKGLQQFALSLEYQYDIATDTDSGPTRSHNEDSCFPAPKTVKSYTSPNKAVVIVCDGIGGHDGGEIASALAIDSLDSGIQRLSLLERRWIPAGIMADLEKFIAQANDLISSRNDQEKRHERQRMGTTLVMGMAYRHELYLAHVGDSRIYYITPKGCHQMTVDDDLASREVRLGYALYRDAIQYPTAGALIQALGMANSTALHANVQRLILDEPCLILCCSDGLSDFDRVDQYWKQEILPLFTGEKSLQEVTQRLIELANTRNGHDNVTVGLLYCQPQPLDRLALPTVIYDQIENSTPTAPITAPDLTFEDGEAEEIPDVDIDMTANSSPQISPTTESLPPVVTPTQQTSSNSSKGWIIIAVIMALVGGIVFGLAKAMDRSNHNNPTPIPSNTYSPAPSSSSESSSVESSSSQESSSSTSEPSTPLSSPTQTP